MAGHRYVGFLRKEELCYVDPDFRELVRASYKIPGFGSHGTSSSGHFDPEWDEGRFWPRPWGNLGFAVLPEKSHIEELLKILYDHTQTDTDAFIGISENNLLYSDKMKASTRYDPSIELKPYSITITNEGLYVVQVEVTLGDNGCLDTVPDHCQSPIQIEGNSEAFEKSQQRYLEIQKFWKILSEKVEAYNQKHGFIETDFTKSEFEPFR